MHTFFATNNLGGGGTNVSRFIIYLKSLKTQEIGVLLNYYYLNNDFKKKVQFDKNLLKGILEHDNIREFLSHASDVFKSKKWFSNSSKINDNDQIKEYILDSGSGNMLRDFIKDGSLDDKVMANLTISYHEFAERLNFDLVVAMDYALKYTHKQDEGNNEDYQKLTSELVSNDKENLKILHETLKGLKQKSYKHKVLAPLHGFDFDSFNNYLEAILSLENDLGKQFDGFALGGIADTKKLKNDIWKVPNNLKLDEKNIWIVTKLTQQTAKKAPDRLLHILGAGNIKALPFLTWAGATSSDCHSAWRRVNDANKDNKPPKILVPLFEENLNFIDNKNIFKYVNLDKASSYDFPKIDNFSIKDIIDLHKSNNPEDRYYAKILIFIHALYQYDRLIKFMQENPNKYLELLTNTHDKQFNGLYQKMIDLLCK